MKLLVLFSALLALAAALGGRGFGDDYQWKSLDDGLAESASTGKPVMMVVHKSWCGACKRLGPQFAASEEIKALAEDFVLINVVDDEEPSEDKYRPDGGYIPRVLFLNPEGEVLPEFNSGNPKYLYFYGSPSQIASQMRAARAAVPAEARSEL